MNVVIAIDSFKGSMTSMQAALKPLSLIHI